MHFTGLQAAEIRTTTYGTHTYIFNSNDDFSDDMAVDECATSGAYLARINTEEEGNFMSQYGRANLNGRPMRVGLYHTDGKYMV